MTLYRRVKPKTTAKLILNLESAHKLYLILTSYYCRFLEGEGFNTTSEKSYCIDGADF